MAAPTTGEVAARLCAFVLLLNLHHAVAVGSESSAKNGRGTFVMAQALFEERYLSSYRRMPTVWTRNGPQKLLNKLGEKPLPAAVDWRSRLNTSPVKNQKRCGACWAFSAVETVESMYSIQYNSTPPRVSSVQEVIDCSEKNGCNGGNINTALNWMKQTGYPIVSENEYPLRDESGDCSYLRIGSEGIVLTEFGTYDFSKNESILQRVLAEVGPVAVAVDATTWLGYLGGVIRWHCGTRLNHAVQIVGYDATGPVPFYIVRNSWGTDFGHDGYLYVEVGKNMCGIAMEVSVVEGTKLARL